MNDDLNFTFSLDDIPHFSFGMPDDETLARYIAIKGEKGEKGDGDMSSSVYDTNHNGIVDNAEKVNNHTVAADVPADAVFTDTIYDDTEIKADLNDKVDAADLATVATSGSYSDLSNKPTIPANTSDLNNDSGFLTDVPIASASTLGGIKVGSNLSITSDGTLSATGGGGGSTYTAGNGISISANDEISIDTSVVAELSDLPTVNDGTLTIQHNGTTKGTFTANQSTASTVNIETIYADDYISTSPIPTTVTTAMIENGAVTTAKIDWSTMAPTLTSQSTTGINFNMSWKKRVYPNGEIEWFGTGQVHVQQQQHSASTVTTTLPVSYDWTEMVLISNLYSDQRMFIYNAVPRGTTLTIGVGNAWTATVDGDVHVNVYIKQY